VRGKPIRTRNGYSESLSELSVSIVDTGDGLRIVGELTDCNAHLLASALEPRVAQGGDLTLDLAELSYIDVAALHVVAEIAGRLEGRGRLLLKSPHPWVRRLIAIAGVEHLGSLEVVEGAAA
jgi:anti-anti-sigma factor